MDAIQFLKQQHQEVNQLFEQCKALGERAYKSRQDLVQQICQKLAIHDRLEHDCFYPALVQVQEGKQIVLAGLEEHHLVKILLKQLSDLEGTDESYLAKLTVLEELVQHHVQEEEQKMFPIATQSLGRDRLNELGERMQTLFEELKQEPHVTITMLEQVGLETESI